MKTKKLYRERKEYTLFNVRENGMDFNLFFSKYRATNNNSNNKQKVQKTKSEREKMEENAKEKDSNQWALKIMKSVNILNIKYEIYVFVKHTHVYIAI